MFHVVKILIADWLALAYNAIANGSLAFLSIERK